VNRAHEEFEEAVASYAIDALDPSEARAFEAHLASCARCQAELADLRRVVAGIGMTGEPIAPPAPLKARTIARATGRPEATPRFEPRPSSTAMSPSQTRARPSSMPWLVAAAAVIVAVASGTYAWSLRSRVESLEQMVAVTSQQADRLRDDLISLRRDSANLIRTIQVMNAPDVRQVVLKGQGPAATASGRAYLSASRGLSFSASQMPALPPDRIYQLWIIAGKTPIGVGTFEVTPDGSASTTVALPPGVTTIEAVAVTSEPKPSGSTTPTMPILLVGPQ
jgi:anti-sigma-K factor RskA/putative zinc finger protein